MSIPSAEPRASILHADLDSFYASVAQRDDPALRGRPVAVGGGGVILAASYEAKRAGISTPMPGHRARALCPGLVIVRPDFPTYTAASRAVFAIFRETTPLVQGVSVDEAFLDVGGLGRIDGSPVDIAARLRRRVAHEVGLPITVGVARTPFLAKTASQAAKPDGLLEVPPDGERAFLHPLPLRRLWGVGEATAGRLGSFGLETVGDLAALPEDVLVGLLGRAGGRHLYAVVHGRTSTTLSLGHRRSSIGAQRALGRGPHRPEHVHAALLGLVDRVTRRLREAEQLAGTVVLRLRFDDYTAVTRSHSLAHPTASTARLADTAVSLLRQARPLVRARGITLVGVALGGLVADRVEQPELSFAEVAAGGGAGRAGGGAARVRDTRELDAAVDALGHRYGGHALTRASLLRDRDALAGPSLDEAVEG
ncbi:DNA polymerase IV [Litorihabitans aurantiacus]|uniref:DNA polymerase IV n=1 Tax=Litorihabitans aurantiacus TaxID=1930061 RepID=UPI0024E0EFD2|nr:DNA polymerase IV [Litorihabitans aurantiacus]